jgi:hypothetical protein
VILSVEVSFASQSHSYDITSYNASAVKTCQHKKLVCSQSYDRCIYNHNTGLKVYFLQIAITALAIN